MIEYLSPIAAVYNILKNAIKDAMDHAELSQRKEIQRKIISLQLILVNIIENADKIYERINVIRSVALEPDQKVLEDIKALAFSQNHALSKLATELEDSTTDEILRLLSPGMRRDLSLHVNSKRARIGLLMKVDDLTTKGIKNLYTNTHIRVRSTEHRKCSRVAPSLALSGNVAVRGAHPTRGNWGQRKLGSGLEK